MSLLLAVSDLLECSSNKDDNTALEDERPFNVLDLEHQDNVELENEERTISNRCVRNIYFYTRYS